MRRNAVLPACLAVGLSFGVAVAQTNDPAATVSTQVPDLTRTPDAAKAAAEEAAAKAEQAAAAARQTAQVPQEDPRAPKVRANIPENVTRPTDVELQPDWEAVRSEVERVRQDKAGAVRVEQLESQAAGEAQETRMPILVPDAEAMGGKMQVYPREKSYAATIEFTDATVEIFGTRLAKALPEEAVRDIGKRVVRDEQGYIIQRTEYGMDLSFVRFGCSYNITVTCTDPLNDPRCAQPDFIKLIADSMSYAGGEPAEGL